MIPKNNFFHDIQIFWDAPVCVCICTYIYIYTQSWPKISAPLVNMIKEGCENYFIKRIHKKIWPFISQLTSPFYSIVFETSICQFKSSEFSLIMPDEDREHLTRDQRPFLHPESLQILQTHSSMLVLLLFCTGPRTVMAIAEAWFCAQWPIFVLFLRFVFGLLYGWKIQSWPIIRFLTETVTYWFFICWYLIESMMPCV